MANLLFATRESDSLRSENPRMSQPSRGLVLAVPWLGDDLSAPPTLAGFPILSSALSLIGVQARPEPAGEGPWRPRRSCARHRPAALRAFVRWGDSDGRTGAGMKDG